MLMLKLWLFWFYPCVDWKVPSILGWSCQEPSHSWSCARYVGTIRQKFVSFPWVIYKRHILSKECMTDWKKNWDVCKDVSSCVLGSTLHAENLISRILFPPTYYVFYGWLYGAQSLTWVLEWATTCIKNNIFNLQNYFVCMSD